MLVIACGIVIAVLFGDGTALILARPLNWLFRKLGLQQPPIVSALADISTVDAKGEVGEVVGEFTKSTTEGILLERVKAKGTIWKAIFESNTTSGQLAQQVEIVRRKGNRLVVRHLG